MTTTPDDSALVGAARDGDRQAYGDLVARYGLVVHGLCAGVVGAPRARELAHEAFVEAWLRLDSLRDPARFAPWLRTLTVNLCRMWYRRERQRQAREADVDVDALSAEAPSPGAPGSAAPSLDALVGGLEQLTGDHRLTLALHYWQGLTCEQIAAFLDVPLGTVLSRLHRARRHLRQRMETETVETDRPGVADADPFRDAVDGEIEVLLRLWQADTDSADERTRGRYFSEAGQRLSELGRSAPDVVRPVLGAMNDALVEHVALLLRRAGPRAFEVAVACAFDPEPELSRSARLVLCDSIAKAADQSLNESYSQLPLRRTLTLILDPLSRAERSDAERAAFLVELLPGCQDDASLVLLAAALRCCGAAGFEQVLARWHAEVDAGGASHATLGVLGRFATPFLAAMTDLLVAPADHRASRRRLAALTALEVAGGFLGGTALFREPRPPDSLELRVSGRLLRDELDPEVRRTLLTRLAAVAEDTEDDAGAAPTRDRAVALLGQFGDAAQAPRLRPYLRHAVASTRMAAIAGLRALGDRTCTSDLLRIARQDEPAARRLALQSLGHLRAPEALDLLLELIEDADVAPQAISALGELGDDTARQALQGLLHGPDKKVARWASRALFGGQRAERPASHLRRERLARIRGADAEPRILVSVVAALRNLPEARDYPEAEITRRIGEVCHDFSTTRRELVMGSPGLMERAGGIYQLSDSGRAVWRVEAWLRRADPRQATIRS